MTGLPSLDGVAATGGIALDRMRQAEPKKLLTQLARKPRTQGRPELGNRLCGPA